MSATASARSGGRSRSTLRARPARGAVSDRLRSHARRVVMKARVVRHQGTRFRSAPLSKHIAYLKREGVTRDGEDARMFDARSGRRRRRGPSPSAARTTAIISGSSSRPKTPAELADLRAFTRELMADVERDLGTKLDWVAVDHWNTDNPHVHVLVRGRADDGAGPGHQPRLHQPGIPRSRRRARHPGARAAHRAGNPDRAGEGSRGRTLDQPRPLACATSPTKAAASPICAPAATTKTRSCGG